MRLYLDASSLAKLVMSEPGSDAADALWNGASSVIASVTAYPETRAALARARRESRLSPRLFARARANLDDRWLDVDGIEIDDPLARAAGEVAEAFSLRALDAVQLAAALTVAEPELVVATWDRRLSDAARSAGLNVAP